MKIRSGGQTGVDRAALELAASLGFPTGGFVPRGCRTERGPAPELVSRFGCTELPSEDYVRRTHENAAHSDGTVWFGWTETPGYRATARAAAKNGKPFLANPTPRGLLRWIRENKIEDLNVAGNRASTHPESARWCRDALRPVLELLRSELRSEATSPTEQPSADAGAPCQEKCQDVGRERRPL